MSAKVARWFALLVAWLALALALMAYVHNFRIGVVPNWSALESAVVPSLGALGVVIVLSDWARYSRMRAVNWSTAKHVGIGVALFLVLFLAQYAVVRYIIESRVG